MTPLCALVGYGYWGTNLARCLHRLGALAAVVDSDGARLGEAYHDYRYIDRAYALDQVLRDPDIDAVCIATPILTHAALVEQALRAGKHVFVEKPLCTELADGARLINLATERGLALMVGHTYLFEPAIQYLGTTVELGDPVLYVADWSACGIVQGDVSVLWSVGPHPASIILAIQDELPKTVTAIGTGYIGDVADAVCLTMRWPGWHDALASVRVSWLGPTKERRLRVIFDGGSAVFDDCAPDGKLTLYDRWLPFNDGKWSLGDTRQPALSGEEPLLAELRHFVECLETGKRPLPDGAAGLDVVRVLAAADESMRRGGAPVEVEPCRSTRKDESLRGITRAGTGAFSVGNTVSSASRLSDTTPSATSGRSRS